ncbi:MAG: phenylpropionate dioxygenase-like ring-hydroxylating dioxygenase large terminal subunit [Candidatus Azotimanducaceae bacterium]|jgi:phenylpropionate dioxygenase-like ring-hydroxylating dioxygenase large terminal subunit
MSEAKSGGTSNSTSDNPSVRTMDESYHKLLDIDTNAAFISDALKINSPLPPGPTLVPVARYIERKYHELEKERLWSKTWQVAAHEDDFANVGDVVPYDITTMSFLIVRCGENEYKAYYNACLHRARKLREVRGTGLDELRCPFHGWSWNLDGSIKQIPCAYDFAGLNKEEESLPEVKLERWGRFIFINPDPDCAPLADHLGDLGSQFEIFPYENRYKMAHVGKVIRANWKTVQDAFMESYHVLMTHPQILTGGAHDMCTKYDAFENYSRAIRCGALESSGMPAWEPVGDLDGTRKLRHPLNGWLYEDLGHEEVLVTNPKGETGKFTVDAGWIEGEITDANPHLCLWVGGRQLSNASMSTMNDPAVAAKIREKLGENASARAVGAEMQRQALKAILPSMAENIPDIELTSAIFMTVFPNWHPWGSFNQINYRFRPNGDNHDECIMECMYLAPIPENGNYKPVREIHMLGVDEDWTEAPELGMLAKIFNQDLRNLPFVYAGMKATAREHLRLADYNELKLRHFHDMYTKRVAYDQ